VQQAFAEGLPTVGRATVTRASGERVAVDLQVIPVAHEQRGFGAALLLRDVSSESHLEARVHDLNEQATTDPLTGVGNRAEFDRVHSTLMETCLQQRTTFSIILCDIDRFKQVNDIYGHQVGDEMLVEFADLLRRWSRSGDLVARYGGEEFVMLCPDCDNATAAHRAEQIRSELAQTRRPMLNQTSLTASFGVTELQAGDTVDTILRRADRALYQAKDGGRNRVVQLGAGFSPEEQRARRGWLSWWRRRPLRSLVQRTLMTNVPLNVAAEKIRGFIADHEADIISIEENQILLAVGVEKFEPRRRRSDRPGTLVVDLQVREIPPDLALQGGHGGTRTEARVTIRPRRGRDRRARADEQAALVLASLKSYLIAQECAGL
jgi:diguanylate cyclase (GGDEF)-like protein